ncbi:MAG: recombination mediator RecR [Clostridia bacterium]
MSEIYPKPLARLIEGFEMYPGIGRKMAQRLAFYTLTMDDDRIAFIADAIATAKRDIVFCSICCNISDKDPCGICMDSRDTSSICVVQSPRDIIAMEKTCEYQGLYHVLHGLISPMEGVSPEDLRIKELMKRLGPEVREIIVATNPSIEGEATAMYLSRLIKPLGIRVSRIAHGISVGSDIEFTDEATLIRALQGRTQL